MAAADETGAARGLRRDVDDRPSAFRYPRGDGVGVEIPEVAAPLEIGGTSCAKAHGSAALAQHAAAGDLEGGGYAGRARLSVTVADARFAKPLDDDLILRLARKHEARSPIEEGSTSSARSCYVLAEHGVLDRG